MTIEHPGPVEHTCNGANPTPVQDCPACALEAAPVGIDVEVQSVTDAAAPTLTANDRCDRCGAQAYVKTRHNSGELLWCVHHADKSAPRELIVVDERSRLVES